jgi:hypothetical protein
MTTAILWAAPAAAGFPLLLWGIGRAVTAAGSRASPSRARRQYLAGRLSGVLITTVVAFDDELLVSLSAQTYGPLAGVFRVAASECSIPRVIRWRNENTPLRAYLSQDGAIMLADPVLGGNAACEPSVTPAPPAPERAASPEQAPTEDR